MEVLSKSGSMSVGRTKGAAALLFALLFIPSLASANCLSQLGGTMNSVAGFIHAFYVVNDPDGGDPPDHYVILRLNDCNGGGSSTDIGSLTLSHGYFRFDSHDPTLLTTLLTAHSLGTRIKIRVSSEIVNNANTVAYVVYPDNGRSSPDRAATWIQVVTEVHARNALSWSDTAAVARGRRQGIQE